MYLNPKTDWRPCFMFLATAIRQGTMMVSHPSGHLLVVFIGRSGGGVLQFLLFHLRLTLRARSTVMPSSEVTGNRTRLTWSLGPGLEKGIYRGREFASQTSKTQQTWLAGASPCGCLDGVSNMKQREFQLTVAAHCSGEVMMLVCQTCLALGGHY